MTGITDGTPSHFAHSNIVLTSGSANMNTMIIEVKICTMAYKMEDVSCEKPINMKVRSNVPVFESEERVELFVIFECAHLQVGV